MATVEAKFKGPEGEGLGLRAKPQRRGKTVVIAVLVLALVTVQRLGELGANILEVSHGRLFLDVPAKGVSLDLTIETRGAEHTGAVLKALAEPSRWQMVERLSCEELCVCHLAEDLGLAQPLVSHHLKVLRDAGLVESEKHRQWTYYRLRREALDALGERFGAITSCCPAPGERRRPCS